MCVCGIRAWDDDKPYEELEGGGGGPRQLQAQGPGGGGVVGVVEV